MDHVKIQINTGEGLKKLIGDSPEMQLEFKDRIVDALVKDHIAPLIGQDNYQAIMREVNAEVQKLKLKYVSDTLTQPGTWNYPLALTTEIKNLILQSVRVEIDTVIKATLAQERSKIIEQFTDLLQRNKHQIENYIQRELDRQISAKVDSQLKEILVHMTDLSKHYANEKAKLTPADATRKIELEL